LTTPCPESPRAAEDHVPIISLFPSAVKNWPLLPLQGARSRQRRHRLREAVKPSPSQRVRVLGGLVRGEEGELVAPPKCTIHVFVRCARGSSLVVLKLVAVAAVAMTIAAGALAGTASARPAGWQCLQVRASVLKTLRAGLRAPVRPQLRSARAVKARGTFAGPFPRRGGVYFMSANLGTRGIATWAASRFFLRGLEGQIGRISLFAMSKTARAVADPNSGFAAGVFPPRVLAAWGITTKTYGYAQSRACVK